MILELADNTATTAAVVDEYYINVPDGNRFVKVKESAFDWLPDNVYAATMAYLQPFQYSELSDCADCQNQDETLGFLGICLSKACKQRKAERQKARNDRRQQRQNRKNERSSARSDAIRAGTIPTGGEIAANIVGNAAGAAMSYFSGGQAGAVNVPGFSNQPGAQFPQQPPRNPNTKFFIIGGAAIVAAGILFFVLKK